MTHRADGGERTQGGQSPIPVPTAPLCAAAACSPKGWSWLWVFPLLLSSGGRKGVWGPLLPPTVPWSPSLWLAGTGSSSSGAELGFSQSSWVLCWRGRSWCGVWDCQDPRVHPIPPGEGLVTPRDTRRWPMAEPGWPWAQSPQPSSMAENRNLLTARSGETPCTSAGEGASCGGFGGAQPNTPMCPQCPSRKQHRDTRGGGTAPGGASDCGCQHPREHTSPAGAWGSWRPPSRGVRCSPPTPLLGSGWS